MKYQCSKCGSEIQTPFTHPPGAELICFPCLDGAERSGGLQACPPSASCSAGAGADAPTNSLNTSSRSARESGLWVEGVLEMVRIELLRAIGKHGPMKSPHEGYAVLQEEVDELWEEVKKNNGREQWALEEAIQVAAMACRYVYDLTERPPSDAGPAEGQRALARNSEATGAERPVR